MKYVVVIDTMRGDRFYMGYSNLVASLAGAEVYSKFDADRYVKQYEGMGNVKSAKVREVRLSLVEE